MSERTVLGSEYRDGNCPAGWNQLQVLKQALRQLPESIETVRWRADTAGYETELLKYCADPEAGEYSDRFGRIEFGTGLKVTEAFKQAVRKAEYWHDYRHVDPEGRCWETSHQWAEVPFVPDWLGYTKRDLGLRFFAIREPILQPELLEDKDAEQLGFPTIELGEGPPRKLFGVVTNRQDLNGEQLIRWLRGRCGWSEKVHSEIKSGLAGDRPPFSDHFQGNAAWWQISWLAYNLHGLMQRFGVGDELDPDRDDPVEPALHPTNDSEPSLSAEPSSTLSRTKRHPEPSSSETDRTTSFTLPTLTGSHKSLALAVSEGPHKRRQTVRRVASRRGRRREVAVAAALSRQCGGVGSRRGGVESPARQREVAGTEPMGF